jgi:glycosyltransferase involved in cell wall biosynthesis
MTRAPLVVHLLEATLGGTRQYLDNIVSAADGLPLRMGLIYATERSDEGFRGTLDRVRAAGWQTWEVPMSRAVRPVHDLRAALQVRRILRDARPDVLHCHSSKAGGVGRIAAALVTERPWIVYSPHALAANVAGRYLAIESVLARFADRFAAISPSESAEIQSFGLAGPRDIDVVFPVVDAGHYAEQDRDAARAALGLGPEPRVLGIGRFIHQKDPVGFVRVVERVRERRPDIRATWVGEGELQAAFEREIANRGLEDRLTVQPWQLDVRPWIAAADVVVSTARFESFGYVVAEAMAMHRPVVASRITGTVDVVKEQPAELLYDAGDYEGAADLVVQLLGDPDRRRRLGAQGAALIRREFSIEAMTRRLSSAYGHAPRVIPESATAAR